MNVSKNNLSFNQVTDMALGILCFAIFYLGMLNLDLILLGLTNLLLVMIIITWAQLIVTKKSNYIIKSKLDSSILPLPAKIKLYLKKLIRNLLLFIFITLPLMLIAKAIFTCMYYET